jgi:DNA repair protein RecO (recombination protein O)
MATHLSPAIIMRIKEFGESDLMVTFFTPDKGRLKGVAKGGRRSKRRFANCLDLFCLTKLEYELKRRGELHFLHSCKLVEGFPGLRSDFSALALASYMIELTEILFPLGVVDRNTFELLKRSLLWLNEGKRADVLRILFEGKAMALAGYGIDFDVCCDCGRTYTGEGSAVFRSSKGGIACLRCGKESELSPGLRPEATKALRTIQSAPWREVETLALANETIARIKQVLKRHIEFHVGRRLKTAEYLE